MTMSKFQLAALLFTKGEATITLPDGRQGIVQSVLRESGSGRSFMVAVLVGRTVESVYVKTID